jgi:hypothetical protein
LEPILVINLKDHEVAKFINNLTQISRDYANTQQLRENIRKCVVSHLKINKEENMSDIIDINPRINKLSKECHLDTKDYISIEMHNSLVSKLASEVYTVIGALYSANGEVHNNTYESILDKLMSIVNNPDILQSNKDLLVPIEIKSNFDRNKLLRKLYKLTEKLCDEPPLEIFNYDSLGYNHLTEMLDTLSNSDFPSDKFNRWIGWIQAALIANGVTTLNKQKKLIKKCYIE